MALAVPWRFCGRRANDSVEWVALHRDWGDAEEFRSPAGEQRLVGSGSLHGAATGRPRRPLFECGWPAQTRSHAGCCAVTNESDRAETAAAISDRRQRTGFVL